MTSDKKPRLYPLDPKALPKTVGIGKRSYLTDAEGGYTPFDSAHRGNLVVNCPSCGKVLVRGVSAEYLAISIFRCWNCHEFSSGKHYPESTIGKP